MFNPATIAANSNTRETTPWVIWSASVMNLADVSYNDMEQFYTRERLARAYSAGEPVWMAADAVHHMVSIGKREERAEREVNYLKGKMKVS